MVRRALLLAALLGVTTSHAQEASPAPPDPAPREDALRRETGRLAMTLALRRTRPTREWVRLSVEVTTKGALVDRTRVLDVSIVRAEEVRWARVRFREPASLRGQALLVRTPARGEERAWRYDPARRRVERIAPPGEDERLGGTGLTWSDLRGEEPQRWSYRLVEEGELTLGKESPRAVLRISARELAPAQQDPRRRRITLDRGSRLPLLVEELDPQGAVARRVWFRRYARFGAGGYRAGLRAIEHGGGQRLSEVRALERRAEVPPRHLDPARFGDGE
ncbi:MAG TPA: hypothetical protein DEA08_17030 [Planctomycetes bacterium]|nr:hypothetical protein [Planctomycetota bacterium]